MTPLDQAYAAMQAGGDAAGGAFYRMLADSELILVLEAEAQGSVLAPRVYDVTDGPVILAFDSEERLAMFSDTPLPYAALPGRVIAGLMAGQGLSLGLNLGCGAVSEMILPPEALVWLVAMLDQKAPEGRLAQVVHLGAPVVPGSVVAALSTVLAIAPMGLGYLVSVGFLGGGQGQMLALTGVALADQDRLARAVTEARAFSGVEAGVLDLAFLVGDEAILGRLAAVGLVFQATPPVAAPQGPGRDPKRPPILR